jgi:hypothetical protein
MSALRNAAENGQGIVVMPQYAAAASLAAGRLIPILQQYTTIKKPITVIYPHRGLVPTKTTAFVDMLTKHIPKALAAVPSPTQPAPDNDGEALVEANTILMGTGVDRQPPPSDGRGFSRRRRIGVEAARS